MHRYRLYTSTPAFPAQRHPHDVFKQTFPLGYTLFPMRGGWGEGVEEPGIVIEALTESPLDLCYLTGFLRGYYNQDTIMVTHDFVDVTFYSAEEQK